MNLKEVSLEEMEIHRTLMSEGLAALIHTILFVRAPNLVKPEDHICERLAPIVYAKCGPSDVDNTVDEAIESLKSSLASVGPYLSKGIILISFFEKREIKGFFGLTSTIENIYFERWRIPVLIDERPLLSSSKNYLQNYNDDNDINNNNNNNNNNISKEGAEAERKYFVDFALKIVQNRLINILEALNNSTDHVPPSVYEYEIEATGPSGEKREQSIVTRLINSPAMMTSMS